MSGRLAFLHTAFVLVDPIRALSRKLLPDIAAFHAADESLLGEILQAGTVTPTVARRIARLALSAEEAGASVIVLTCSSASPCVAMAQPLLRVPFLAIDEAMAELAVARASRIGLLATVRTTLAPTQQLLHAKAAAAGRSVDVTVELSAEAFEALMQGNRDTHDALVADRCRALAGKVECILFAQGSMAPLAARLQGEVPVPILTSLEPGIRRAGEILRDRASRPE